ncbi:MAG: serine/threonine-protein kinase [Planctomycetota bacterium]
MQVGPYTVQEELGRGGSGVVYRATDPRGQPVALKLLLARESNTGRQRFEAEVQALARLHHPHVVKILGAGEHAGCPWLALEFVAGEPLQERLQRRGPLPVDAAVRCALQVAQALSYVHACGVLHRDLKPDNVLLRGEEALLTDFGLVLDQERGGSRLTATGALQGTPGYWAPEQVSGAIHDHGPATDVYGLGGVLYACLTGRPPAEGSTVVELVLKVGQDPTPPRELRPEVPRWLSDLCVRCLARDPAGRPSSADEVARALRAGLSRSTAAQRARRWAAAGVALVALLGGPAGAWSVWRSRRAQPEPSPVAPAPVEPPPPRPAAAPPQPDPPAEPLAPPAATLEANRLRNRGYALFMAERFDAALAPLVRSLELEPDHAQTVGLYGLALDRLGRQEEAIEVYTHAIAVDPDDATYWHNRAVSLSKLNRHDEAIDDYTRALELDPQLAPSHRKRAQSLLAEGRLETALPDVQRAIELAPDHPTAYALLGFIQSERGEASAAVAALERALALGIGPDEAGWVQRLLAENLEKLEAVPR